MEDMSIFASTKKKHKIKQKQNTTHIITKMNDNINILTETEESDIYDSNRSDVWYFCFFI